MLDGVILPLQGIGVYHDSDTSRWHFDQLGEHSFQFNPQDYYHDLSKFLSSDHNLKFAGYHVPFPESREWITRFHETYKQVRHTFIFCSELHDFTVMQLLELDLAGVSIFACGIINHEFKNAEVYQWMDWFNTTSYNYRVYYPKLLSSKLVPQANKPYMFDALLGCRRPNREYVYNKVNGSKLESNFIMTMLNERNQILPENFIMETDGVELVNDRPFQHTINPVRYYGHVMSLSQIIPISVYNQTYYSIITETNSSNQFNFYTEKTTKPLIAGRLFVAFAGQYFLKNLRNMGFQTFGSVIDESYDDEPDTEKRWAMAMKQVEWLCTQDAEQIYNKIELIIKNNQRNILVRDWYNEFSLVLAYIIQRFIK